MQEQRLEGSSEVTLEIEQFSVCQTDPGRLPMSDSPLEVTVSTEMRAPSVETYAATIGSERPICRACGS